MAVDSLPDLSKYTDFAKNLETKYKNKYAYRIGGKDDAVYKSLAQVIKDESAQTLLKSKRTKTVTTVKTLTGGSDPSGTQKIDAAKSRLNFVKEAVTSLKNAPADSEASQMSNAAYQLVKEVSAAVEQYLEGRYDGAASSGDAEFINKAKALIRQLTYISNTQKGRLAANGRIFDAGVNGVKQLAKTIANNLETISLIPPSAGASASTAATSSGGGVDITV